MTRIEFERKCNEVGLYSFAIGNVEREGEHFGVGLEPRASMKCQRIETEKVSAWVRRLGLRVCIATGMKKQRRSPRVIDGKGWGQGTASGSKGMGERHRGAEQAGKNRNVNVSNGVKEKQTHAGPLKYRFSNDRECDHTTEL